MPPDFNRDVVCILGLPFDAIDMAHAEAAVRRAIRERTRCFFSTPNLNFAVGCQSDAAFRNSVLQSDLSLADGWPVVAAARLLGIPLPERVTGSGLFERLCKAPEHSRVGAPLAPVSVYFFGGPDGAAQAACAQLNASAAGVRCAGFDAPGFGSLDEMSSGPRLDSLNAADADFVVVALGAKKGQAWIQRNLRRIEAPVVAHLGAVVNFAAGTVRRAPEWAQWLGLEWLWRVKEEPALWRRYASDGMALIRLLITRVLPLTLYLRLHAPSLQALADARATIAHEPQRDVVRLEGAWMRANLRPLREMLQTQVVQHRPIALDLGAVTCLDGAAIALLTLLYGWHQKAGLEWSVVAVSPQARRSLHLACADYLLAEP